MPVKPVDIRRAAMDLLARREHGFDELIQKLGKRFSRRASAAATQAQHPDSDAAPSSGPSASPGIEQQAETPLPERITAALEQLKSEGLQSDVRMAQAFVWSRAQRGRGPRKIKAELHARGLDDAVIRQAIESCEVDWFALARAVAEKRYGDMRPESGFDLRMQARCSRFLQQRGFCFKHINALD